MDYKGGAVQATGLPHNADSEGNALAASNDSAVASDLD